MKKTLLLPALLLAACLAGCAEGPTLPNGNPQSPETAGAPAVLLDEGLGDVVAVDLVRVGANANGFLTVQANLRNRTSQDQQLQVQTLFFDASDNVLGEESAAWTTLPLTANATEPYRAQALTKKAARATLRVRYMHRPS